MSSQRNKFFQVTIYCPSAPEELQRRVELTAFLAHQSLTSTAPTYLSADIQLVSEHCRRHLRLRSSSGRTLAVPRTRTTLGDRIRSFAVAGPRVWNCLPATDSLSNI